MVRICGYSDTSTKHKASADVDDWCLSEIIGKKCNVVYVNMSDDVYIDYAGFISLLERRRRVVRAFKLVARL